MNFISVKKLIILCGFTALFSAFLFLGVYAATPTDIYTGADLTTISEGKNNVNVINNGTYVTFTATGNDPHIYLRDSVVSNTDSYILIKYRSTYAYGAQIYFRAAEPCVKLNWNGTGEWSTIIVNATDAGTNWTNRNVFRFDPLSNDAVNLSGCYVDIEYIAFFPSESAAKQYAAEAEGGAFVPSEEYVSDAFTFSTYSSGYAVSACSTTSDALAIPSKFNGSNVIRLSKGAFSSVSTLKILYVPPTVTSVASNTFTSSMTFAVAGVAGSAAETAAKNAGLTFIAVTDPSNFTFYVTGNVATITGYTGPLSDITIPPFLMGYRVSSIGTEAFENNGLITSVSTVYGLSEIQQDAFKGCTKLAKFTADDTLSQIGKAAFADCTSLSSLELGNTEKIADFAFLNCSALKNLVLPQTVKSIGIRAFSGIGVQTVEVPKSATYINQYSFLQCTSLDEITVNSANTAYSAVNGILYSKNKADLVLCPQGYSGNVTVHYNTVTIARGAFIGCKNITGIDVLNVTRIEPYAFYDCDALGKVTLTLYITDIFPDAFLQCDNISVSCYFNSAVHLYCAKYSIPHEFITTNMISGDINGDREFNIKDLIRLKKYLIDNTVLIFTDAADVNGDEKVNSSDYAEIAKSLI